jgi:hypothetical protein
MLKTTIKRLMGRARGEPTVYVVRMSTAGTFYFLQFKDGRSQFKAEAERQGTICTLRQFQRAFNHQSIDTAKDMIYFEF